MPTSDTTQPRDSAQCRLIVVGAGMGALVRGEEGFGNYAEVVTEHPDLGQWLASPSSGEVADLVVASCPTLFPETLASLRARMSEVGARRVVVVYEFAQRETELATADPSHGITALRSPVRPEDLRAACEAEIALATLRERWDGQPLGEAGTPPSEEAEGIPPRQFSDAQLAKIGQISTTIDCECPHHLSALLVSLNAFETYSRECESRDDQDAILHAYLHRSTAKARSIMEDALVVLAEAEGIEVDPADDQP